MRTSVSSRIVFEGQYGPITGVHYLTPFLAAPLQASQKTVQGGRPESQQAAQSGGQPLQHAAQSGGQPSTLQAALPPAAPVGAGGAGRMGSGAERRRSAGGAEVRDPAERAHGVSVMIVSSPSLLLFWQRLKLFVDATRAGDGVVLFCTPPPTCYVALTFRCHFAKRMLRLS